MAGLAMIFDAQDIIQTVDAEQALGGALIRYCNNSLGQRGLSGGQLRDLRSMHEQAQQISVDSLDEMAHLKTGLAIELSLVASALVARVPQEVIELLKTYAYHTGIAFQIKDDLLDATSTEAETGKNCGSDKKNAKPNYVSVLGLQAANYKLAEHLGHAKKVLADLPEGILDRKLVEVVDYIADKKA